MSELHEPDVRTRLIQRYPHLRPAEKKVANYLLSEARGTDEITLDAVAHGANASRAAVVRMCQALGFSGFRPFQLVWVRESALAARNGTPQDAPKESIFTPLIGEFHKSVQTMNLPEVDRAAELIGASRHVAVCGAVGLSLVAQLASLWFERIGFTSNALVGDVAEFPLPGFIDAHAVLVVLSMTGRNPSVLAVVDAARARGSMVVSVLHDTAAPLATKSDVVLACALPVEEGDRNIWRARVAVVQLAVVEVLLEAVARKVEQGAHVRPGTAE